MLKRLLLLLTALFFSAPVNATTRAADYISANTYNNLYPYMNNTMRTNLNPGTTPSQSQAQINVLTRTIPSSTSETRKVVPRTSTARSATSRSSSTNARSATTSAAARSATPTTTSAYRAASTPSNTSSTSARRVVARTASTTRNAVSSNNVSAGVRTSNRYNNSTVTRSTLADAAQASNNTTAISSSRCLADYTECMNGYCERANTAYNRCYCSAKLSQIDAEYQPEIDRLIKEILIKKGSGSAYNEDEMNEYWASTIGKYTGDNSWTNIDEALNSIDWASTESRVRGQQAFNTGHEYCIQHLQGCYYMASNLRDAYRSDISRDCAAYESSLQSLKGVAESLLEALN